MPAAGWKRGISGEARACTAGNNRARQGATGDLVAASVDHSSTVLTESGGPFLVPSRTGYGICCDLRKETKPVAPGAGALRAALRCARLPRNGSHPLCMNLRSGETSTWLLGQRHPREPPA